MKRIHPGNRVEVKESGKGILISPITKSGTDKYRGVVKGRLSMADLERLYAEKP